MLVSSITLILKHCNSWQGLPTPDSTQYLYRGLLRDARDLELSVALSSLACDAEGKDNILHVLDRIISEWTRHRVEARPRNDFLELVWEDGQISSQGQSSRVRKSPCCRSLPSHCLPSHSLKDIEHG